jgi:glycosyltransferase involved in cell wall biosynthesis
MAFESADWGHTATQWQKSLHPPHMQARLSTLHEGVDTAVVRPQADARFALPGGRTLSAKDRIVTYVTRNLEPYRGFHSLMRALPLLLRRDPEVEVVIVGGDEIGYGAPPPPGSTFREAMLAELDGQLDLSRVHFLGPLDYGHYLSLLQVSSAHVYLTYPFVLSWSFIEALAAGCLVVGSATAPVLEVLEDGVNGIAVDFFSAEAIADGIQKALSDRKLGRTLRSAARRTAVDRYDLRRRALPSWVRLLKTLAAGRTPGR